MHETKNDNRNSTRIILRRCRISLEDTCTRILVRNMDRRPRLGNVLVGRKWRRDSERERRMATLAGSLKDQPLAETQAALHRLGAAWQPVNESELKALDEILAKT